MINERRNHTDPEPRRNQTSPYRAKDEHQQRGLARHVLASGVDRLAKAGARRVKIGFEPDNAAAKHLYLSVGFESDAENDILAGPTSA